MMSRRVVAAAYGGPENLVVEQFDPAPLTPGHVRVSVKAVGFNPYDIKSYRGSMNADESKLPIRLGAEASGVVTEVPDDGAAGPTGPISVGDEVIVYRATGAYTDELVVPVDAVLAKPPQLSFDEAAGLMLTGVTAAHLLQATGVSAGDTVVIHGAAGGVGQAAIQLAVQSGATIIATASAGRHDRLRALGATPVAYGPGLIDRIRAAAQHVDVALDAAGTDEALDVSLELVKDRTRIATIVNFTRGPQEGIHVLGGGGAEELTIRNAARLTLLDRVRHGAYAVDVEKTFPLDLAADAHRYAAEHHLHGKVILRP